jgi:hypothetical protein
MPEPKNKKPTEIKRLCPECDQEVTLAVDAESGDREGRCSNCGLDVGAVVNKLRYAKATKKVQDEEEIEKKKQNKPKGWLEGL